MSLFPTSEAEYICKMRIEIHASEVLTFLGCPADSIVIKENDSEGKEKLEQHHVVIECDPDVTSKKDTCIFFQTPSTNKP